MHRPNASGSRPFVDILPKVRNSRVRLAPIQAKKLGESKRDIFAQKHHVVDPILHYQ
jgi:hypothetical protein